MFEEWINRCADAFGPPPRKVRLWNRSKFPRLPKPDWIEQNPFDDIKVLFRNLDALYQEGEVLWGHVIQANYQLWEDGTTNCPGEVVYSFEAGATVDPDELAGTARALFSLKGTQPEDPALASIADYLTDEMIRVFGLRVPEPVSPDLPARISTVYFVRKHLPVPRLARGLLPMLVRRRDPAVATVLPSKYWPEDLVRWWSEE